MKLLSLWQKTAGAGGINREEFQSDDRVIVLRFDSSISEFLGFSIFEYKRRNKFKNFEHILLNKEEILKNFVPTILKPDNKSHFIECDCKSEIIRIIYDDELKEFDIDIFDNWFYFSAKKGVVDSISLPKKEAEKLARTLKLYANTVMK